MTNDQIDGFAALRQGASQFAQYAGTVASIGADASTRASTLARAAFSFSFFRASIPLHCAPPSTSVQPASIEITDKIRQAVLLAEGVAHSLVGETHPLSEADAAKKDRIAAIDCYRQLQDWPGSPQTEALRQQASYNEAIVWRQMGFYGRCVLMLTEILGERAPDTMVAGYDEKSAVRIEKPPLPSSIRFPARLARLAAFAQYSLDDWSTLPQSRAQLLIDDAEKLVDELKGVCAQGHLSVHDHRMAEYMYIEALRAIGHVELLRVIPVLLPISTTTNDQPDSKTERLMKSAGPGLSDLFAGCSTANNTHLVAIFIAISQNRTFCSKTSVPPKVTRDTLLWKALPN